MNTSLIASALTRLDSAFKDRPVMPFHAVQYRVAEVGRNAIDPRLLAVLLHRLTVDGSASSRASELDPRERLDAAEIRNALDLRQPRPGLLAKGEVDENEIDAALRTIHRIAAGDRHSVIQALAEQASSTLRQSIGGKAGRLTIPPSASVQQVAGHIRLDRPEAVWHHRVRGAQPIRIWLTHELSWIGPDDPRFWREAFQAHDAGARLLIIARKVSPALFPVLQTIGALALQMWWHVTEQSVPESLSSEAEKIGWLPLRTIEEARRHAVWDRVHMHATALIAPVPREAIARLETAKRHLLEFGIPASAHIPPRITASRERIIEWARAIDLDASPRWWQALDLWGRLSDGSESMVDRTQDAMHQLEDDFTPDEVARDDITSEGDTGNNRSTGREDRRQTEVVRIPVAADVDRETWEKLLERWRPA